MTTGPRSTDPYLPPEFDSRVASDVSSVIDSLNEMGWKLRGVSGCAVGDYKYDVEQVLRAASVRLTELADSVRKEYAPDVTG